MQKNKLAKELRAHAHAAQVAPRHIIDAVPDDLVIQAYNICNCCGELFMTQEEFENAILEAKDTKDFLRIIAMTDEERARKAA